MVRRLSNVSPGVRTKTDELKKEGTYQPTLTLLLGMHGKGQGHFWAGGIKKKPKKRKVRKIEVPAKPTMPADEKKTPASTAPSVAKSPCAAGQVKKKEKTPDKADPRKPSAIPPEVADQSPAVNATTTVEALPLTPTASTERASPKPEEAPAASDNSTTPAKGPSPSPGSEDGGAVSTEEVSASAVNAIGTGHVGFVTRSFLHVLYFGIPFTFVVTIVGAAYVYKKGINLSSLKYY